MITFPNINNASVSQQFAAKLIYRVVRGIMIALVTIACACLAGGMADGATPDYGSSNLVTSEFVDG